MALMTEERRKEMEEEMSRFELEIAAPGGMKSAAGGNALSNKPLSPPPPPPAVGVIIPEALAKAPPASPASSSSSSPQHPLLRPPPPPPVQSRPQSGSIRFIPHQVHRQAPRPHMRPNFVPMRGVPMGGPPNPFPSPTGMAPFGPPMGQVPQMHRVGPQMHGGSMSHMPPGPMSMPPGPMGMPPQMGNMNVNLPMPPGFCPPTGPVSRMMHGDPQGYDMSQNFDPASAAESSEPVTVVAAAPAIYAAPFVKSHAESSSETPVSSNGQESIQTSTVTVTTPKTEKTSVTKTEEHIVGPTVPAPSNTEETVISKKKEKKKKIVRMAGGQAWEDNSLQEWETDDFRIFCGDLGNDVTDEVLIRAFSKYPSFVKAKVIRDKRTNKTKGYGFVSFKDPQDFIKAMREMNGKYVGSRPIKLRKSTWRDRNIDIVKKKQREKEKLGLL